MNKTTIRVIISVLVILLFIPSNVNAQDIDVPDVYDVKALVKKALLEGRVEVIDCKMEKSLYDDGVGLIKITGTAKYIPAKFRKKKLEKTDFIRLVATLYDANGSKLSSRIGIYEYGENKQPENVKYKKPFPFWGERDTQSGFTAMGMDNWNKASYCEIRGWNTSKTVSSKDSN